MKVNPLPPQAYTKETLQKAYAWLLNQSASVKDMATNQDMLVSLYLKAQRNGDESLETPSIQNFKKELKNLANMIGDLQPLEQVSLHANHQIAQQASPQVNHKRTVPQTQAPLFIETETSEATLTSGLDAQSLQMIQDIKCTLNLSSETEALRALIALGFKQFKKMC